MPDPLAALPVGSRVVVRHRLGPDAVTSSGARLTDVVGDLVALDEDHLEVSTRGGTVTVERSTVVAAKQIPPRPARRGAPHLAISVDDLQRVMVDAWPPLEREPLGEWLLRASGGFTNRGNSVLPTGQPGLPLGEAVDAVEHWYAGRGLPTTFEVFGTMGFAVEEDPLGRELLDRGYLPRSSTCVMTAATAVVGDGGSHLEQVRVSPTLEDAWLATYCGTRGVPEVFARAVLTGSPQQWFASVVEHDHLIGIGRVALAHQWAGVGALWVDPTQRRRGMGRELMATTARLARSHGIRSMHLQTEQDNTSARALHQKMGFRIHHAYEYLSPPE